MTCPSESELERFADGEALPEVEGHARTCPSCTRKLEELLRATGAPSPDDAADSANGATLKSPAGRILGSANDPLPPRLGRYVILGKLGSGGMGVVYAAYDPQLDRRVALKLVRADRDAGAASHQRLLLEAQSLARLRHPNVVTVFDVGEHAQQIFFAMELVQGSSLKEWLREPRGWHERLQPLLEAGEGLAAAHRAGVIHRDFKPDNVVVSERGEVRVVDFGLSRAESAEQLEGVERSRSSQGATLTGSVVGTPGYMAPEQFQGRATDERTDQFNFCASVYEALYGERPFRGETLREIEEATCRGLPAEPPAGSDVPERLWPVIRRGLAVDPNARHAHLDVVLAELRHVSLTLVRRRPVMIAAAAVVAILLALGGIVGLRAHEKAHRCDEADPVEGLWANQKPELAKRFAAAGPAGEGAWNAFETAVTKYAADHVRLRHQSCVAYRIEKTQPEALQAEQSRCLDRAGASLESLLRISSTASAEEVPRLTKGAQSLPEIAECANALVLLGTVPMPSEAQRSSVEKVELSLAEVETLRATGRYPDAISAGNRALDAATATGFLPIEADAEYDLAMALRALGQTEKAVELFDLSLQHALASEDRRTAVESATQGLEIRGEENHVVASQLYQKVAEGLIATLPNPDSLKARMLFVVGWAALNAGQLEVADKSVGGALALVQHRDPNSLETARYLHDYGVVLGAERRWKDAATAIEQARALDEKLLGPLHPNTIDAISALAHMHTGSGDLKSAEREYLKAKQMLTSIGLGSSKDAEYLLINLGDLYYQEGRYQEALDQAQSAEDVLKKLGVPPSRSTAIVLKLIALCQHSLGHHEEALRAGRASVALWEKLNKGNPEYAVALARVGQELVELGKRGEGREFLLRAIAQVRFDNPTEAEADANASIELAKLSASQKGSRGEVGKWLARAKAAIARSPGDTNEAQDEVDAFEAHHRG